MMLKRVRRWSSMVADYTVGTVIVLFLGPSEDSRGDQARAAGAQPRQS